MKTTNDKDSDKDSDSDDSDMDIVNEIMGEDDDEDSDEDAKLGGDSMDGNGKKPEIKPKPASLARGASRAGSFFYAQQSAARLYSALQGGGAAGAGGAGGGGMSRSISERFGAGSAGSKKGALPANNTIFDAFARGVPVQRSTRTAEPPVWLLSSSAVIKNPPQMHFDSLGMHILDYGFGPHALVTVRELDDEMQPHHTLEQQSRTGVLGRIVAGAWSKVAEVCRLHNACSSNILHFDCYVLG